MITDKWKDSLVGKKVKCISNRSGNGLQIGGIYYIHSKASIGPQAVNVSSSKNGPKIYGWCKLDELQPLDVTIEDFIDSLKDLEEDQEKISEDKIKIKEKIEFMKKNNLEEFDEDMYKIHKTMKILGIEDINKAKEIAKIFKD